MHRLFFCVFGEFQAPPIGLEYELQRVESVTVDPLEDAGEKRLFRYVWTWSQCRSLLQDCFLAGGELTGTSLPTPVTSVLVASFDFPSSVCAEEQEVMTA